MIDKTIEQHSNQQFYDAIQKCRADEKGTYVLNVNGDVSANFNKMISLLHELQIPHIANFDKLSIDFHKGKTLFFVGKERNHLNYETK